MASKAVARTETPSVPALASTPALDIGLEDIALPRLYIGQYTSQAVKQQLVRPGSIFVARGQDDPDPEVLSPDGTTDAPIVYVLHMRRGKSVSDGGELTLYDFDDPSAPPEAWTTYNYHVCVPAFDTTLPVKWLLTRTGKNAAQSINTVLAKNASAGPPWIHAFKFTTAQRQNKKGEFFVARIASVDANPEDVDAAGELYMQIAGSLTETSFSNSANEPAI